MIPARSLSDGSADIQVSELTTQTVEIALQVNKFTHCADNQTKIDESVHSTPFPISTLEH
jgi:hypothetical protein